MILKNAKIICEEEAISNGWIEIKDNKIIKITAAGHTDQGGYDLQQAIISGSDDTLTKILTVYQGYMKNKVIWKIIIRPPRKHDKLVSI